MLIEFTVAIALLTLIYFMEPGIDKYAGGGSN